MAPALDPLLGDDWPPEIKAQFVHLQKKFLADLPKRWHDISQAASPQALHACLHRLIGAAASFGFEGLGQMAQQLQAHSDANRPLQEPMLALKEAIDQALKSFDLGLDPGLDLAPLEREQNRSV